VTTFNGRDLLNGTGGIIDIQVGTHNDPFKDRISFNTSAANSSLESLGLTAESLATKEGAQQSLSIVDGAMISVNAMRANFGAMQNRLNSTIANLAVAHENLSAANSRIRDTDVAAETAELTRNSIMMQAGVSVLGQANTMQQVAGLLSTKELFFTEFPIHRLDISPTTSTSQSGTFVQFFSFSDWTVSFSRQTLPN
jgi:flagellin